MIGYVTLGTNDLARSIAFYDDLLATLGAKRMMESETFVAWSTSATAPAVSLIKPFDGNAATVGNGTMVALAVESPEQVKAVHAKALELGAANEGDPGERFSGFYAAYFRDPDGNKLNAFCMTPTS